LFLLAGRRILEFRNAFLERISLFRECGDGLVADDDAAADAGRKKKEGTHTKEDLAFHILNITYYNAFRQPIDD
jgi:hypothetical protein